MKLKQVAGALPVGMRQFIKFNIVGVLNTAIDFAVFTLLTYSGLYYLVSQLISYSCGLINSYLLNRFWTFGHRGCFDPIQALKFILVNLVSLGAALGALYMLRDVLGFHVLVSKICATAVSLVVNFTGNRLWVFREKKVNHKGVEAQRKEKN